MKTAYLSGYGLLSATHCSVYFAPHVLKRYYLYIPASWTGHVGKLVFYWTGHNCTQYVVGMSRYIVCRKVIYNKNDHQQR